MKFNTYLGLISFTLTLQQCSANRIDENGNGVIYNSKRQERLLGKREERSFYDYDGYGGYDGYSDYEQGDPPESIFQIRAGYEHTCALVNIRGIRYYGIKCWGSNGSGQLGLGDTLPRGDQKNEMGDDLPFVKFVRHQYISYLGAGGFHTCAKLDDGRVKCFGDNRYGQLALGDTNNRGDEPDEMGDNLPYIDIGKPIDLITAGLFHTCISAREDLRVACFGNNQYGQLGVGNMINRGGSPDHLGLNTLFADLQFDGEEVLFGASYIMSGATANHTCYFSMGTGSLKCWGSNTKGQLGLGDTNNRGDQPNEMGNNLPKIKYQRELWDVDVYVGGTNTCLKASTDYYSDGISKDSAYCFGDNQYGQLGVGHTNNIGDDPNEITNNLKPMNLGQNKYVWDLSIGSNHICVLVTGNAVKCFGQNSFGQLGQGDKINRGGSTSTIGDKLPNISLGLSGSKSRDVASGNAHTCVRMTRKNLPDTLKCFGNGSKGILGYGDTKNRGDEKNEMGNKLPRVTFKYWAPSKSPSHAPTFKPVVKPTKFPTQPTTTKRPTEYPTKYPASAAPTTMSPTVKPTYSPINPTKKPTRKKKNGL